MTLHVLSLFSGVGGLDLGLERAGMTTVGQVELDPFCRRVLAHHWPEVPRHDDVRTCVDWWWGEPRPPVHVVAGGVPCQPFSSAGRQQGVADERWGWPWMERVVRALRPRFVLVECVAALLADRDAFGWLLGDLAESGYDAEWDCVPAAAVGARHRRDRLFLVAYANREPRGPMPSPETAARRYAEGPPEPGRRGRVVADTEGVRRPEQRRLSAPTGRDGEPDVDRCRPYIYRQRPEASGDQWAAEPDVGRVAHGVPSRVDRLRGLGNAVVPQVAEYIGRLIVAASLEASDV